MVLDPTHETLCPASALLTDALFRCIVFTAVGINCPTESGPSRTASLADGRISLMYGDGKSQ